MRMTFNFLGLLCLFTACQAVDGNIFSEYTSIPRICVGKFVRVKDIPEDTVFGSFVLYEEFDMAKGFSVNSSVSWGWYNGWSSDVKGFNLIRDKKVKKVNLKNNQSAIGLAGLCYKASVSLGYTLSRHVRKEQVLSAVYFGIGGLYIKEQCCSEFFPEYRYDNKSGEYLDASYILEGAKEEVSVGLDFKAFYVSRGACIMFSVFAKIFDLQAFDDENYKFITFGEKSVLDYTASPAVIQKYSVSKALLSNTGVEDFLINSSISMSHKSGRRSSIGVMFTAEYISKKLQKERFWSDFDNINDTYIGKLNVDLSRDQQSNSVFNYIQFGVCLMYQIII